MTTSSSNSNPSSINLLINNSPHQDKTNNQANKELKNSITSTVATLVYTLKDQTSLVSVSSQDPKEKKLLVIKAVKLVLVRDAQRRMSWWGRSKRERGKDRKETGRIEAGLGKKSSNKKMAVVKNASAHYLKIARLVSVKFQKVFVKQNFLPKDVNFVAAMDAIPAIWTRNTSTHHNSIPTMKWVDTTRVRTTRMRVT